MKYRSMVPLNSAPDAREEPRVRWHKLAPDVLLLVEQCGIMDGATMQEARRCVEAHMRKLNDAQRRKLLMKLGMLLK